MSRRRLLASVAVAVTLAAVASDRPAAQPAPDGNPFRELRWRTIGPFRGGRTKAATGVRQQPNVFYIGAVNGGVWKSTDYGRVWTPIFDDQPTGSIGAIAVAPSDPNILYVGSGEGLQRPDLSTGNGMYKSTDAGRTWTHLGLADGQQIPQIVVDPTNPDRVFVAVLGHPYGPNDERGIYRTIDGGRTFQRVLFKDADTGGIDVALDPSNASHVYAVLWQARQGPWENGAFKGPGSGLFESTDGGDHWAPLTSGLPTFEQGLGRIGITIAPSDPKRMYAAVESGETGGLFRSDDAGQSWTRATDDPRVVERGDDFAEVKVDPKNPDIVYTASVVSWKSVDGGKTFRAFRGAPGGDDYHRIWINPDNPDVMLIASDQGAIVTVNGGATWSSWYNQPTAQFYHVSADNAFPYRVCGGQQESGSACVASRSDDGRITDREWHPVGVEEYGYVAPDPLNPDFVYGGKVTRYDRRTNIVTDVGPRPLRGGQSGDYRTVRTMPILFSPVDPHVLYFASNTVWKTTTGGLQGWTQISPDLTRKTWDVPANVGVYRDTPQAKPSQKGVIYTLAPGYTDINTMWAGTDDGLIQVTKDGGRTWSDVTPPDLKPWAKVSMMDASHTDADGAYAAINTLRLDDLRPHIYRTHDGGRTWTHITNGIPDGATVNTVREDPKRKGLLFAGTETQAYVSFDDGDHWQSLRNNMPATSIRDLIVKDDDLVVGTHGRGFWILDDITPLRQWNAADATQGSTLAQGSTGAQGSTVAQGFSPASTDVYLLKPQTAIRFEWSKWPDTPLPPDEPSGQNPPDGAVINYYLRQPASGVVTLEILDANGGVIRRYASDEKASEVADVGNWPRWWIRPAKVLSAEAGLHRFVWDLHYPMPAGVDVEYPISAVPGDTAPVPKGPWVVPGTYTVRLTAGGQASSQPLTVKMDPRVKTPAIAVQQQFTLAKRVYDAIGRVHARMGPDASPELKRLFARLQQVYGLTQEGAGPIPVQNITAIEAALKDAEQLLR